MLKCFILIGSKTYKGLSKSSEHFDLPDRLFHRQITKANSNVLSKATVKKWHFLFADRHNKENLGQPSVRTDTLKARYDLEIQKVRHYSTYRLLRMININKNECILPLPSFICIQIRMGQTFSHSKRGNNCVAHNWQDD